MAKLYNLARVTTATTGTGTITLGSAVSGFLSFDDAGVQNGDTVSYGIKDGTSSEVGSGVYDSAAKTLTRNVSKSTNSDQPINLSGSAEVFITPLAEDYYTLDEVSDELDSMSDALDGMSNALSNMQDALDGKVPASRQVATSGLATGGGDLTANLTINVPVATKEEAEAGSNNTKAMTPLRVAEAIAKLASPTGPGIAKAWVNFNGTGTVAIRSSYNVSSITDLGVGKYQVNFAAPLPDANYVVAGTHRPGAVGSVGLNPDNLQNMKTTSFDIETTGGTPAALVDPLYVGIVVFGG